jgi:hypothetical protein
MSDAKIAPNLPQWMLDHVHAYLSSGGTEGHMYKVTPPFEATTTKPLPTSP